MAPRKSTQDLSSPPRRTLVIDNGGHTIKAGFSSPAFADPPPAPSDDSQTPQTALPLPSIIPNCLARDRDKKVYIGSQLSRCDDFNEMIFRRPVERGYLVNWEAEKEIWEHEFFDQKAALKCDPSETGLILTEAPNALPQLQTNCDQVVFEEFGFASYYRCPAPSLNAYHNIQSLFPVPRAPPKTSSPAEILLLIDSGYSHTTVTPLLQGQAIQPAVRRLDIGGKFLTNYLARLISRRQYDMRNDTYIVNEIKEACCYVSRDFKGDMERTWKGPKGDRREVYATSEGIAIDYVLPDYHKRSKGYARDHDPNAAGKLKNLTTGKSVEAAEDILTLRNERFTVPEILFNPSDIGMRQSGIAQLIWDSLSAVPFGLWPGFLANVVIVGGNANVPGFSERLDMEIRSLAPAECIVRVAKAADPIVSTWQGGAILATDVEALKRLSITKQEYEEHGAAWAARKFDGR
ncbi:Actin-like ATPase [Glarea lozoyensis ATCC 20868]|uniref:Actin-like ATPase n=1 Tax=Glarea lozoyensis (strain ATCC 20868 / MF5171) TaxID=1116229 RepID=S3CV63_GLAL2|nr:Actin-like ATPase [Glarea lozoyensis ATCC 20868]EPE28844.1 Actin-like ATPase [Glarea lozoyensis ATCC 20868]